MGLKRSPHPAPGSSIRNSDTTEPKRPCGRPRKPENKTASPTPYRFSRPLAQRVLPLPSLGQAKGAGRRRGLVTKGRGPRQSGFRTLRLAPVALPYLSISLSYSLASGSALRPRAPPRWKIVPALDPRRWPTERRRAHSILLTPRDLSRVQRKRGADGSGRASGQRRRDPRTAAGRGARGAGPGRGGRRGAARGWGRNMSPAAGR